MRFTQTKLAGVYLVELEARSDERGFFARSFCEHEFAEVGLPTHFPQCNISFNHKKGTLRGMHYQAAPHGEPKLVRCTMGAIYDVAVDLRPDSPSFKGWVGFELNAHNRDALFIPEGCAHGFLTLEDDSEVFYQMGQFFAPGSARGLRYNDPAFAIEWPAPIELVHERDAGYADFEG
jgi:dTDP-4-dehydrorhamnose 3,5-epimerase